MSEDKERADASADATLAGVDPIAVALALGGASRADANAFLNDQRALIADQRHHLHEQFKHLHLGIWEKQLGVMLRVATMVMGLTIAGALGFMVWQASQSNGLLVEPFSVPPDMAQRGLTGEVVAARVLDQLTLMQSQTNTARPAKSYTNAWNEHGIKLEIPEAGISLAELDNWLRQKLGHDIRVTGEIVRNASGVTITARAGDEGAETVRGPDGDVDELVKRLAESIYRLTQPYRYAAYLLRHENRAADAVPIFKRLTLAGSPEDRLWSYNMWADSVATLEGIDAGLRMYQQALATDPDTIGAYDNVAGALTTKGRLEEALQLRQAKLVHLTNGRQTYVPSAGIPAALRRSQVGLDSALGAYHDATPVAADFVRTGVLGIPPQNLLAALIGTQTGEHDLSAARARLVDFPAGARRATLEIGIDTDAGDWAGIVAQQKVITAAISKDPFLRFMEPTVWAPFIAYAQARLGNFTAAEARIAPTPGDCYPCLVTRAQIAELRGAQARADWWFAQALRAGPSLPFAYTNWGQALLARGQPDAAIAQFKLANLKGPHFADPREGWGEALMAKNQSHLALAKFAEAEKYAPNWGRLHLKWGEALAYAGKPAEAKAQLARAAALDLTPSEKAELAKASAHV